MNVQNHEKKAFKDLTPEERSAIVEAWLAGQCQSYYRKSEEWSGNTGDWLFKNSICRTRPRQLVIPWEHIKPEYKWVVMNEDEGLWVYVEKPEIYNEEMWDIRGKCCPLPLNIDTAGIDWRESLVQRPE